MSPPVLPFFPEGALASSVITTVWVGVFIVCLFNLRLGWVLSGLVVPGYIAPLLIAKPIAALVVIAEAVLTYGLFWVLSEKLSGPATWSSFFGRDRFLGLILVSAAVRLSFEGALLPMVSDWLNRSYGFEFDWHNNLHGFGLVVIALFANQLWKPGLARGLAQSLTILGITSVIIRYGLMEFTNFRISGVLYLYEDFASSILASPKAYIVLIATCFVASRMNLRYGWDFGGILIPALLALQWYQPLKIVSSIIEGAVIFALGSLLLKTRLFANTTVEGARKILLFFNISFAYKLVLGHALSWAGIEQRITDFYGFGYLLPTLIAIKAYDKDILPRVGRAVLQISFVGAAVGSAIGFALLVLVPERSGADAAARANQGAPPEVRSLVARAAGAAYSEAVGVKPVGLNRRDAAAFGAAIGVLDGGGSAKEAAALLASAGYSLTPTSGGSLAVVPNKSGDGTLFVFNPGAARNLTVVVPEPSSQPGLALAAARIFEVQQARWLAIGDQPADAPGAQAPAAAPALFRRAAHNAEMIVRRGARSGTPVIHLAGAAVAGLQLRALREQIPQLAVKFTSRAQLKDNPDSSTLLLPQSSAQLLIGDAHRPQQQLTFADMIGQAPGVLASGRESRRREPARVLDLVELAFLRFEVVEPLLAGADEGSDHVIRASAAAAASIGFEVTEIQGPNGARLVALRRRGDTTGAYLIRPGARDRPIIQVAADEERSTVEAATQMFEGLGARAFLMTPSQAELDHGQGALLPLITQSLLRSSGERPQLTLQVRTPPQSVLAAGTAGVVIAPDRLEPGPGLGTELQERLFVLGLVARVVNWDIPSAGLEVAPNPHLRYIQQSSNKRFAIVWVPSSRRLHRS